MTQADINEVQMCVTTPPLEKANAKNAEIF